MYVVQVVGYKNSGKTTLISEWLTYLSEKGYETATIKHHGHGGEPEQIKETDHYRHFVSGASLSAVVGENELLLTADKRKLPMKPLLQLYHSLGVEVVIIEGYKQLPLPKIVLPNDSDRLQDKLTNVQYVYQGDTKQLFHTVEANWHLFDWEKIKAVF
ncbi:molybdopterin-guanine dinucleotide biosynthesis protein B [Gracilibacillus sp. S3-1-1]|uniref:Molybdopterin-guanine dinucleotide biosynthesis protein B n=1 Tax=Gracilibacillus pellucidus TaxID=3095368 RepID=A0ACC6M1G8_9BACI|nr:molybdopterin-guanine dinucleotide biosynthesis protein B [Gracilibacillus sp. S3-1-1]MDX8044746.1 molybdopterin-guanine dinucleotide biosynthesis protein B [Gracilibacillus sp. S3-1-1]